jgi:transcription elongation factor Elf1
MSGQTASSSPPQALSSSRCGRCQGPTTVQRVIPARAGFEHWTLRCTRCGHIQEMQVASTLSQSDPVDWFDSDLYSLR